MFSLVLLALAGMSLWLFFWMAGLIHSWQVHSRISFHEPLLGCVIVRATRRSLLDPTVTALENNLEQYLVVCYNSPNGFLAALLIQNDMKSHASLLMFEVFAVEGFSLLVSMRVWPLRLQLSVHCRPLFHFLKTILRSARFW